MIFGVLLRKSTTQMTNLDILQGLNEAQRAAVVNFDRPSLIIAGAGSGKTRVLTSR
ncbi:MAG: UvrD-helicase domain-containing protein, partial [Alistipes sp.]|nr:UvrD-helicase domain-containing protein [Alistipes sp.]